MSRILLLGKNGQLGWELHRALLPLGEVIALDAPKLDFTNLNLLSEQVKEAAPDMIINAVAYTAVDEAESHRDLVMRINAQAPRLLAELACELRAIFVHYSTDFVFDGLKNAPYTEGDQPNPLSVYAESKVAGDQAILEVDSASLILRSSWIYSKRRDNFVKKVLGWAHTRTEMGVVTDQVGCPTWARDLANATAQMLAHSTGNRFDWAKERRGIYNVVCSGYTSRYEWAAEILKLDPKHSEQTIRTLNPARTEDFPSPARRPAFSALDCTRFYETFGLRLPDWRVSLPLALEGD